MVDPQVYLSKLQDAATERELVSQLTPDRNIRLKNEQRAADLRRSIDKLKQLMRPYPGDSRLGHPARAPRACLAVASTKVNVATIVGQPESIGHHEESFCDQLARNRPHACASAAVPG